ncbi:MAG: hypothetical protein E7496_08975 [Ruminococcus sp.]|nr:hypothetical protein [Ruminococcus sp.]
MLKEILNAIFKGVEATKDYRGVYEPWDTYSLKSEFKNLAKQSRTIDTAAKMSAIKLVLESRGIYIEKR